MDASSNEYAVLGTTGRKGNCYRVEHGPHCLDETLGESVEQMLNLTRQPVSADWLRQTCTAICSYQCSGGMCYRF